MRARQADRFEAQGETHKLCAAGWLVPRRIWRLRACEPGDRSSRFAAWQFVRRGSSPAGMPPALAAGVNTPSGCALSLRTQSSRAAWSSPSARLWLHRCWGWHSCPRSGLSFMARAKRARARCCSLLHRSAVTVANEDLPNFRATDAAFGEIPAAFNDTLLPLNELGLAERIRQAKSTTACATSPMASRRAAARPTRNWPRLTGGTVIEMAIASRSRPERKRQMRSRATHAKFAWPARRCDGSIWPPPETEPQISLIASRKRCRRPNELNGLRSDAQ